MVYLLFLTASNTWLVPETKGAIVQGGYGHTSVYDEITKSIYVHGGYKALPGNKYGLVDDLYKYEVNTKTWWVDWAEVWWENLSLLCSIFVVFIKYFQWDILGLFTSLFQLMIFYYVAKAQNNTFSM